MCAALPQQWKAGKRLCKVASNRRPLSETGEIAYRLIKHFNLVAPRRRWPLPRQRHEALDRFPVALDNDLYITVGPVPHPSTQAEVAGDLHCPCPEAHALNPSA